jgi:hypothetical protein
MSAFTEQLAIVVLARLSVVEAVAVANVEAVGGAKAPKRMLYEARKHLRVFRIKGTGIDLGCDRPNDLGAAARAIAGHAIAVGNAAIPKDAGPVQKVMHQGIDGNHAFAGLEPMRAMIFNPQQQPGEGHGEDLVGDAVNVAEGALLAAPGALRRDRSGRNLKRGAGMVRRSSIQPIRSPLATSRTKRKKL